MKERRLKDSETNRQLLASSRRVKKLYQFFAVIIATAFISSAITLTISADGPTGFGTVIEPGSMVIDPSYIVFPDSSSYYVRNGDTGAIDHSGTSAAAAIQYAIDSLTAGRASKEKVLLKGDFSLSASIVLKSYTVLECDGAVRLADSIGLSMLKTTAYTTDFEIVGGVWDGNAIGQTPAAPTKVSFICELQNAHHGLIFDATFRNASYDCLLLAGGSSDIIVSGCIADGSRDDGFNPLDVSGIVFNNCIAKNVTNDGFHISADSRDIVVSACIAHGNGGSGYLQYSTAANTVFADSMAYDNGYGFYLAGINATISGCIARDNSIDGVFISVAGVANPATSLSIQDSQVFGNGGKGINCGGRDVLILGCDIHNNIGAGIYLTGALDITISASRVEANGANGILAGSTVHNLTIGNCLIYSNIGYGILTSGQKAVFSGNIVKNNTLNQVHLSAGADYAQIIGNTLIGGVIGIAIGQTIGGAALGVIIQGNSIIQPSTWGIQANYAHSAVIVSNYIDGPRTGAGATPYDSIALTGSNYSIVAENVCANANRRDLTIYTGTIGIEVHDNVFGMAVVSDSGTGTDFENNIGYVTENVGAATITGSVSTVTVNHGLVTTPTIVLVTGNNTGIGDYWVTTIAGTTFTISFESQPGTSIWKFYWYAEV